MVGNIQNWDNSKLVHQCFCFLSHVIFCTVHEQIDGLIAAACPQLLQKVHPAVAVEAIIDNCICQQSMARTYSSSNSLAWLIASPIFNLDIFMRVCPSKFREASRFEYAFICKNEMASLLDNAIELLVQCYDLVLELLEPHRLPLWGVEDLDFLHLDPRLLHKLGQDMWSNPPV